VNHDLVAAGHPRLNFEFAAFRANLPPHWNEDKKTRSPGSLTAAWAVGQAITAKAALQLLAHRASGAKGDLHPTPWPEFAEYDCFACHHELQAPSWRQEPAFARRRSGSLAWSTWYYAMPRLLAEPVYANVPDLLRSLDELDRVMRKPSPDKDLVAVEAQKAVRQINGVLLKKLSSVRPDATSLALAYRRNLANVKLAVTQGNWDSAAQLYLALAALEAERHDPQINAVIHELFQNLAFPAGKEADEQHDSPKDYQPKLLHEILKPLQR
jgi:hypothetical protein